MIRVLLIDDDANYRYIFVRLVIDRLTVETAENMADALVVLARESFDCVIIDPGLPDSEAVETVQRIKSAFPGAVCVALSGNEDPKVKAASIRAGAHAYLFKGKNDMTAEDIYQVVSSAITKKETWA